jgi:hypothetical protein
VLSSAAAATLNLRAVSAVAPGAGQLEMNLGNAALTIYTKEIEPINGQASRHLAEPG